MFVIGVVYIVILQIISSLFSLTTLSGLLSSTSNNFESGFFAVQTSQVRYRFSMWMIVIHYVLFEIELTLVLLYLFSFITFSSQILLLILLTFLLLDLLF